MVIPLDKVEIIKQCHKTLLYYEDNTKGGGYSMTRDRFQHIYACFFFNKLDIKSKVFCSFYFFILFFCYVNFKLSRFLVNIKKVVFSPLSSVD